MPDVASDTPQTTAKPKIGPPRIFVEVMWDVEGADYGYRVRREISLEAFQMASLPILKAVINECLADIKQHGR